MEEFLRAIRARGADSGVMVASRYVKGVLSCLDSPTCRISDIPSAKLQEAIKAADETPVYTDPAAELVGGLCRMPDGAWRSFGRDKHARKERTKAHGKMPGSIMEFDCIITTTKQDRDGDVLECKGADIDEDMPLLWQHVPFEPIGRCGYIFDRTEKRIPGHFGIADVPLGRDAAVLVEFKALRISHGFKPTKWEPLSKNKVQTADGGGFHVVEYKMLETSLVSVPSCDEAVILAFSRQKLHHPLVKGWARAKFDGRPAVVTSGWAKSCSCGGSACGKGADVPEPLCSVSGCKEVAVSGTKFCKQHQPAEKSFKERWNRSLSKAFDVSAEPLPVSCLEYDWVCRYLECEVRHLHPCETAVPSSRMGSFLTGLKSLLGEHKLVDVRNIAGSYESPPRYEVVRLTSQKSDDFLVEGAAFYEGARHKFVVKFEPRYWGVSVTVYTRDAEKDFGQGLIDKSWRWARENNFLKGEAFALSGEFLTRTSEGWGDIFVEEVNSKPVKRAVEIMNQKGVKYPNRGMIFCGPPGTGKTLSGRVMRNTASATFIWISSRDFHYAGSFGGVSLGFELAKELAPSILFIEDVDNWLYDTTVDLVKTEMDGIARSTGVLTVLTTNFPERIPEALIDRPGRFHDVLKFDYPTAAARAAMVAKWLPELDAPAAADAVRRMEGWSGAHVYDVAQMAKSFVEHDGVDLKQAVADALEKTEEQKDLVSELQGQPRYRRGYVPRTLKSISSGRGDVLKCGADLGMPYFDGSYEQITDVLEDSAHEHLAESGIDVQPQDQVYVIGTFDDFAIMCVRGMPSPFPGYGQENDFDADDGYRYYRCDWLMVGGSPEWDGEPTAIEISATFREATKGYIMAHTKGGRAVSAANRRLLKEATELFDETSQHHKTTAAHRAMCDDARDTVKGVIGNDSEEEEGGEEPMEKPMEKAGRVLSKANLAIVQKAHDAANELSDHAEMHRPGKAMMREARGYLKAVIDNANPETVDENPGVTGEPNPGAGPTKGSADSVAAALLGKMLSGQYPDDGIVGALKETVDRRVEEISYGALSQIM